MSMISKLLAKDKVIAVPFPDMEDFVVSVAYIDRETLRKLREQAMVIKYNKRTKLREEEVDNTKFNELYAEKAIRGWTGLTASKLGKLLPVDFTKISGGDEEIPYSPEDAAFLLTNSTIFDSVIANALNDFEAFGIQKQEEEIKN